jgi:predicted transcriptional regulator
MTIKDVVDQLNLHVCTQNTDLSGSVSGGYASDLLSNVMGKAAEQALWVTLQTHANIVAVGLLVGVSAIIVAGGHQPAADTIAKAEQEGIPILVTEKPAFEIIGLLYQLGIHGI